MLRPASVSLTRRFSAAPCTGDGISLREDHKELFSTLQVRSGNYWQPALLCSMAQMR